MTKKLDYTKQIGGDHYTIMKIQPWQIIDGHNLNYFEGNAIKYLLRRKTKRNIIKNRIEDLQKAIHYLEHEIQRLELIYEK